MAMRVGHVALTVSDLDAAVEFFTSVLLLEETVREGDRSYLTCNDRHHELILVKGRKDGVDHFGLEVDDAAEVEAVAQGAAAAGGKRLGPAPDEPGIAGGELVESPGGFVFKIFHGMESVPAPQPDPTGVRPRRFEHISLKTPKPAPLERFLEEGLGFELSDRLGSMASWWHCETDHHGIAVQRAPQNHLHHHAWTQGDLNAQGATADILHSRGQILTWGPGRHGPGNNHFIYFKGPSGALIECCSDMAQMGEGSTYVPRTWPFKPISVSLWGGVTPPKFIFAGTPVVRG